MRLEHLNVTVPDPRATAKVLHDLFGWEVRWEGSAIGNGYAVHVGEPGDGKSYLALYAPGEALEPAPDSYHTTSGLNHIGVVVEDIDAVEEGVKAAGFTPHNHGDYEPGKRFYFDGPDGIEYEVVSYD